MPDRIPLPEDRIPLPEEVRPRPRRSLWRMCVEGAREALEQVLSRSRAAEHDRRKREVREAFDRGCRQPRP